MSSYSRLSIIIGRMISNCSSQSLDSKCTYRRKKRRRRWQIMRKNCVAQYRTTFNKWIIIQLINSSIDWIVSLLYKHEIECWSNIRSNRWIVYSKYANERHPFHTSGSTFYLDVQCSFSMFSINNKSL